MKKLILLLAVVVAALSVGVTASQAASTPDSLPGGGNGGGCSASGNFVDASPSYLEMYAGVNCPDSPNARVYINVCIQRYEAGYGWTGVDCVANQGWGYTSATAVSVCDHTTYDYEYRGWGFAEAVLPDGQVIENTTVSPATFAKCFVA